MSEYGTYVREGTITQWMLVARTGTVADDDEEGCTWSFSTAHYSGTSKPQAGMKVELIFSKYHQLIRVREKRQAERFTLPASALNPNMGIRELAGIAHDQGFKVEVDLGRVHRGHVNDEAFAEKYLGIVPPEHQAKCGVLAIPETFDHSRRTRP